MSSSVSHLTNSINATVDVWKLDVSRSHKSYDFALLSFNTCMFHHVSSRYSSLLATHMAWEGWLRLAGKERIQKSAFGLGSCGPGAGWEVYGYADLSVGRHGWAERVTTMTQLKNGMSQVSVLCHAHGEKADARSHFLYMSHWFTMYFLHFSKWQALYLPNMQVNIRVDRLCCLHPWLQNLRNGWLKLFVVVLVPVQYVYSVYYTIYCTHDVPKAFGMFVRVFLVMPNRLFDSFLKVEGTPSKVSQPRSIQDEKQFKIYVVT